MDKYCPKLVFHPNEDNLLSSFSSQVHFQDFSAKAFFTLWAKKTAYYTFFLPVLGHFWCPVATLVTFSTNLSKFEKKKKKKKK